MKKELFKKLAQLEAVKDEIESEIKVARELVKGEMENAEVDKVESEYGSFFFVPRRRYVYSSAVESAAAALDALKKSEEENPSTPVTETKSLTFRPKKSHE